MENQSNSIHEWTEPRLCQSKDLTKAWFVHFDFTDGNTGVSYRKQFRDGINYIDTIEERRKAGNALILALKQKLESGWNPVTKVIDGIPEESLTDLGRLAAKMSFAAALDFAIEKKEPNISPKSLSDYTVVKNIAIAAAKKVAIGKNKFIADMPVASVTRRYIKVLLEQMQKDRQVAYDLDYKEKMEKYLNKVPGAKMKEPVHKKFTGNSYNKYKQFLLILFSELEEYEVVEYNPCTKISDKAEIKTNIHRHPTAKEEQLIKQKLKEAKIELYVFLAFEELSGLRPKEILGLRIEDIDWFNQWFDIWPTDGRSKTREARKAPIPNALVPLIKMLQLENCPDPNYYIFSTDLKPGAKRRHSNRVTELFDVLIHQELGLDISLYAFKGLGGEKKREAGISMEAVSKQSFGHTKLSTTDIYLEREDERNRRVIREHTPDF